MNNTVDLVIFSKNRPLQLDLLLRSIKRYYCEWEKQNIVVLYKSENDTFDNGYKLCIKRNNKIKFHRQSDNFKEDLKKIIQIDNKYIQFSTDDDVYIDKFDLSCLKYLDNEDIATISLRLGVNIEETYSGNYKTKLPDYNNDYIYEWRNSSGDWKYPMSVDNNIFRKKDIVGYINNCEYKNPNYFEKCMADNPLPQKNIKFFEFPKVIGIPANRVQDDFINNSLNINIDLLNSYYLEGKQISLLNMNLANTNSVHAKNVRYKMEPQSESDVPLVSIIITTYNDSYYLANAIRSCNMQNIKKEIIVVDDCSDISYSQDVIKIIYYNNAKIIRAKNNMWLAEARNYGISQAAADWVITLDADDYFYKNSLLGLYDNRGDSQIIYGNMRRFDMVYIPPKNIDRKTIMEGNPLSASSLYNKCVWVKNGGYLTKNKKYHEDWNFWVRAWKNGFKFKYVDIDVYRHYERQESMSRDRDNYREQAMKLALEEITT